MLPLYYGSRGEIIGQPRSLWRHYPVRLESIFSTRCGNDCAVPEPTGPTGRRSTAVLHGSLYDTVKRHRDSPMKITASAPEPYSVNDWRIDVSSAPACPRCEPRHITYACISARTPGTIDSGSCESLCDLFSLSLSLSFSLLSFSSSIPCRTVCSSSCIPLGRASPFCARRGLLSKPGDRHYTVFTLYFRVTYPGSMCVDVTVRRVIGHHRVIL